VRLGTYPIYSRDWHGIDLVDVAREAGVPEKTVANRDVYSALYRRWARASFRASPEWAGGKQKVADAIRSTILRHAPPPELAISLGAGLGLVEQHLIRSGWNVELQECQAESLDYARRFVATRVWTTDFAGLPSAAYSAVLAIGLVYVFDTAGYRTFVRECARMLKPGGLLLVWDHDPRLPLALVKRFFDRYVRGRHDLRWGWLRSPAVHTALVASQGLQPIDARFFDARIDEVPPPSRVAGFQMPAERSVALCLLFRKPMRDA